MQTGKSVPMSVIRRLPRYYKCLGSLLIDGIDKISSQELSKKISVTASQIRHDLSFFGGFGQQGYGYNVSFLHKKIGHILGIDEKFHVIIVGAGNIGKALANYDNFKRNNFVISAMFDVNDEIVGKLTGHLVVQHIDVMNVYIQNNHVDIAALCIPHNHARIMADRLINLGVRGLWNFSPIELESAEGVFVENVYLIDGLMTLGYKIRSL